MLKMLNAVLKCWNSSTCCRIVNEHGFYIDLITHIDRTTVLYKHVYHPYRCVQSAVYAAEHSQKQFFLGYASAVFRIKIFGN